MIPVADFLDNGEQNESANKHRERYVYRMEGSNETFPKPLK